MKTIYIIFAVAVIIGVLVYFGFVNVDVSPKQKFNERLSRLDEQFESTKKSFEGGLLSETKYKEKLEDLISKQENLYAEVKKYPWNDSEMTDYNQWFRGIMKFPSKLEQEYQKYFG
ncbi:MAG: hypothetical protein ACKO7Y_02365 [Candidatus Nitrosotenuis sp.]